MMMRTHESPMDFQYENPLKQDQNSPFRLAGLEQSLSFGVENNAMKRNWQGETAVKPLPFQFTTPKSIPHGRGIFTPSSAPRFDLGYKQETPGTDNTEEITDDGVSEQDSPQAHVLRNTKRNKLSDIAKLKIRRRRQKHIKDFQQDVVSDEEDPSNISLPTDKLSQSNSWSLHDHRDLPYIASGYLQLFFNLFLLSVLLYFLVSFIMTIQADVNKKVEEYSTEILAEMSICSKEYLANRCSPDQRVPAMQMACQAWERCMERDPAKVGRARVSAETFAEIVNSLIEPISYKTMVFCLVLIFGSLFISNAAFSLLRQKQYSPQEIQQPTHALPQPATFMIQATPQTIHRHKNIRR